MGWDSLRTTHGRLALLGAIAHAGLSGAQQEYVLLMLDGAARADISLARGTSRQAAFKTYHGATARLRAYFEAVARGELAPHLPGTIA